MPLKRGLTIILALLSLSCGAMPQTWAAVPVVDLSDRASPNDQTTQQDEGSAQSPGQLRIEAVSPDVPDSPSSGITSRPARIAALVGSDGFIRPAMASGSRWFSGQSRRRLAKILLFLEPFGPAITVKAGNRYAAVRVTSRSTS